MIYNNTLAAAAEAQLSIVAPAEISICSTGAYELYQSVDGSTWRLASSSPYSEISRKVSVHFGTIKIVNKAASSNLLALDYYRTTVGPGDNFSAVVHAAGTITRPANTTGYSANTSINTAAGALGVIANAIPAPGASGVILQAALTTSRATWATAVRAHLYLDTVTAYADQAAFALLFANRDKRIASLDFSSWASGGTGSDCAFSAATGLNIPFTLPAGSKQILFMLETRGAAGASDSGQVFALALRTIQP